jgi:hypothetical protein
MRFDEMNKGDLEKGPIMTRSRAGWKRDCRVRLHASPHPGISDVAEGTLRGSPAYDFVYLFKRFVEKAKWRLDDPVRPTIHQPMQDIRRCVTQYPSGGIKSRC